MANVDMGIGRRLAIGFGSVLALLLVALGIYLYGNSQQAEAGSRLTDLIIPRADAAQDLKGALRQQSAGVRAYVLSGDERFLADYRSGIDEANQAVSLLDRLPKASEGIILFDQMRPIVTLYREQADRAVALRQQGRQAEASQILLQDMHPTRTDLETRADAFVDLQLRYRDEAKAALDRAQEESSRNSIVVVLLALILGAALAYRTALSVRRPVQALVSASDRLAAGDYPSAIKLAQGVAGNRSDTRDEVRRLAARFGFAAQDLLLREARLSAHSDLSSVLASTIDTGQVVDGALRVMAEHVGAETGAVYCFDPDAGVLVRGGSYCLGEGVAETVALKDGVVGEAAASRHTVVMKDLADDLPFKVRLGVDELPPRWVTAVPMLVQSELVGALLLAGLGSLNREDVEFLESGAGQIAISLQNALAHEKIQLQNEQLQVQNEEIQTQSEEIQAQYEELQVQNEELEAQNEELQTQAEELSELSRALSESEELFRSIFQQAAVGIARVGVDGRFLEVNERLCEIAGYQQEELLKLTFQEITHPDDLEADLAQAGRLRSGEIDSYSIEKRYLRKDASVVWVNLTGSAVRDPSGEPICYIAAMEDITLRKAIEAERNRLVEELSAERARLEAIFENAPEGIVFTDERARIIFTNPTADRLYARPVPYGECYDRHSEFQLCHPDGAPYDARDLPLTRAALDGETSTNVDMTIAWPDGQRRDLLVNCAAVRNDQGKIAGAVGVFQDVTAIKSSEREREQLLAEIQRRAAQQEEFTAIISHDLRSPITAIQGNSQMLQKYADRPEAVRRSAEAIFLSARRMNRMIQDLVDSSKLEAGQLRMERISLDLPSFVEDVKNRLSTSMDIDRVSVKAPEVLPPVLADPDRMERVLTNLISNALKYSNEGVEVKLEGNDGSVKVTVTDHGPGIHPDDLTRIFDKYYRAENARGSDGLGLGLYITRMLVEAHGGRTWAESEVGKGSTFIVEIPAGDPTGGTEIVCSQRTTGQLLLSEPVAEGEELSQKPLVG